jgi:hypothetical protein
MRPFFTLTRASRLGEAARERSRVIAALLAVVRRRAYSSPGQQSGIRAFRASRASRASAMLPRDAAPCAARPERSGEFIAGVRPEA